MIGQAQQHPEWRVLTERLSAEEYGAEVSHEELSTLVGLTPRTPRYYAQMRRTKKALEHDWNRSLEPIAGRGYRLLLPAEHESRGRRKFVIGVRRQRDGCRTLGATNTALLSADQNRKLGDTIAKAGAWLSHSLSFLATTKPSLKPAPPDVPKMLTAIKDNA